jgi:hypothetical protein
MPYIEVSESNVLKMIEEECNESQDEKFINKLMKLSLKVMNDWPTEYLDIKILKKMKKSVDIHLKEYADMAGDES